MIEEAVILNFPSLSYGRLETPFDLTPLLYLGGARARANKVALMIKRGELGVLLKERVPLIEKIHQELNGNLVGGGSRISLESKILAFRYFISWVDQQGIVLHIDNVQQIYLRWTDSEIDRVRSGEGLDERGTYIRAASVGNTLMSVLDGRIPLIGLSRLKIPKNHIGSISPKSEKQNLQDTFRFAEALFNICDAFTVDAVLWNDLPSVRVKTVVA